MLLLDALEVGIGREQHQFVPNTELREKRIDRADLTAVSAACVAKLRGFDVIAPLRGDEGQHRKPLHDPIAGLRTAKALEELLQDEACRKDRIAGRERVRERCDGRHRRGRIAAQR
jgi:hypothetical protein